MHTTFIPIIQKEVIHLSTVLATLLNRNDVCKRGSKVQQPKPTSETYFLDKISYIMVNYNFSDHLHEISDRFECKLFHIKEENYRQETTSWWTQMFQQHRDHSGGNFQIIEMLSWLIQQLNHVMIPGDEPSYMIQELKHAKISIECRMNIYFYFCLYLLDLFIISWLDIFDTGNIIQLFQI